MGGPAAGSGTSRAKLASRKDDLYQTPPEAVHALLRVERLPHRLWEPACGPGAIVRVLREAGHHVLATDLVDYASPDQDHARIDFLLPWGSLDVTGIEAIITNPPFKNAEAFVERALQVAPKVVMLARLAFLESERRRPILDDAPLARVHLFRKRLPMMHREGWEGRKANSGMPFAWFVWERGHSGPIELHRISWDKY